MRLDDLNVSGDGRLTSPSAERNRVPIAEVLSQVLPQSGLVLEVGSGTGEHAVHFTADIDESAVRCYGNHGALDGTAIGMVRLFKLRKDCFERFFLRRLFRGKLRGAPGRKFFRSGEVG